MSTVLVQRELVLALAQAMTPTGHARLVERIVETARAQEGIFVKDTDKVELPAPRGADSVSDEWNLRARGWNDCLATIKYLNGIL